jgi:hypothetical protein
MKTEAKKKWVWSLIFSFSFAWSIIQLMGTILQRKQAADTESAACSAYGQFNWGM